MNEFELNNSIFEQSEDDYEQLTLEGFSSEEKPEEASDTVVGVSETTSGRTTQKKAVAADPLAITTAPERVTNIISQKFRQALMPIKNDTAYVTYGASEFFSRMGFSVKKDSTSSRFKAILGQENLTPEGERIIDAGLSKIDNDALITMMMFYSAAYENLMPDSTDKDLHVYLPGFWDTFDQYRETMDEKHRAVTDINELYEYMGVLNRTVVIPFFSIKGYDMETQIIVMEFPYFNALQKAITKEAEVKNKATGEVSYLKPTVSQHVQSDIFRDRNKYAPLIVCAIDAGLAERGTVPDANLPENRKKTTTKKNFGLVTYSITFLDLIRSIPFLHDKLFTRGENGKLPLTATVNTILKRAFEATYRLLRDKTDLYDYYNQLKVTEIIPTSSALDTELVITHRGVRNAPKDETASESI